MRNLLIKYLALNYDYKVLGKTRGHFRAVNPFIFLFCAAGLYNLLTIGFDWVQGLSFIPCIIVFLIWLKLRKQTFDEGQLTWEQYFQQLSALGARTPYDRDRLKELKERMETTFNNPWAKTVNAYRFYFPWLVILLSCLIYGLCGFYEIGFEPMRGF